MGATQGRRRPGWILTGPAGTLASCLPLITAGAARADPVGANGWLVFMTQQSLRARSHAGVVAAFLLLSGLLVAVVVLSVAQLVAGVGARVDPPQGDGGPKGFFFGRNPTRSPP